ncbi:DUF4184 family protein [Microbacterium elymi]|uniref:DUF4184 family protein n=1 Tax=Microbacterium elymi TaxID=2909587 RepID=A0ABY5NIX0_9MICO|nr:DUF4184 family protein [Microbacterium elymi]UUT35120.1 DUF4184 family protein [Microbacterium elymi]
MPQAGSGVRQTFALRPGARSVLGDILLLVLALALGVASHIAWDAFSHEGASGVGLVPALDAQWGPLVGYKWVQARVERDRGRRARGVGAAPACVVRAAFRWRGCFQAGCRGHGCSRCRSCSSWHGWRGWSCSAR